MPDIQYTIMWVDSLSWVWDLKKLPGSFGFCANYHLNVSLSITHLLYEDLENMWTRFMVLALFFRLWLLYGKILYIICYTKKRLVLANIWKKPYILIGSNERSNSGYLTLPGLMWLRRSCSVCLLQNKDLWSVIKMF